MTNDNTATLIVNSIVAILANKVADSAQTIMEERFNGLRSEILTKEMFEQEYFRNILERMIEIMQTREFDTAVQEIVREEIRDLPREQAIQEIIREEIRDMDNRIEAVEQRRSENEAMEEITGLLSDPENRAIIVKALFGMEG